MKRQRTDTAAGAVQAMGDIQEIPVPGHLDLDAVGRIHWGMITRTKAASLWTENDLHLAGELAHCRSEVTKIRNVMKQAEIDAEREDEMYVPKWEHHKYVEDLLKRDQSLTKLLQLHPEATVGKARDQQKKNQAASQARDSVGGAGSLLAKPVH